MDKPKHTYEIEIQIGGFDLNDVLDELRGIIDRIEEHGGDYVGMGGGRFGCYRLHSTKNENVTRESYQNGMTVYLKDKSGATGE